MKKYLLEGEVISFIKNPIASLDPEEEFKVITHDKIEHLKKYECADPFNWLIDEEEQIAMIEHSSPWTFLDSFNLYIKRLALSFLLSDRETKAFKFGLKWIDD